MEPMDLTKTYPRSPNERLGPFIWLPRLIDKARADLTGTLGEYSYNCPMDQKWFGFLGLDAAAFKAAVQKDSRDAAILNWVQANMQKRSEAEIAKFNDELASAGPADKPGETWFRSIDKEEGRAS